MAKRKYKPLPQPEGYKPVVMGGKKKLLIFSDKPDIKKHQIVQSPTYQGFKVQNCGADKETTDILIEDYSDLSKIEDSSYDSILLPGTLEYEYPWKTIPILKECHRILKTKGHLAVIVSHLEKIGQALAEGDLHRTLSMPKSGGVAITPSIILWGDPNRILHNEKWARKCGFTNKWLNSLMVTTGFNPAQTSPIDHELLVVAEKI